MSQQDAPQQGRFEKFGTFFKACAGAVILFFALSIFTLFPPGTQVVLVLLGALVALKVYRSHRAKRIALAEGQDLLVQQETDPGADSTASFSGTSKYSN